MKKLATLLCLAALGLSALTHAEVSVKAEMKAMGQGFKAVNEAKDAAALKKELAGLRDASIKAQSKVATSANKGDMDKTFLDGIGKLIAAIDSAAALADAGKLDEAKAAIGNIKAVRDEFHKKLRG